MQTRRFIRWAVAAVLAASALALAACSGSSSDKAGGAEEREPRRAHVRELHRRHPAASSSVFAEEVARLSGGTLRIEFEHGWRRG